MKNFLISLFCIICIGLSPSCHAQEMHNVAVTPGAERWEEYGHLLADKRVGATVNHTSQVKGEHLVDVLLAKEVNVAKVFAPEHGFRGKADAGAKVDDMKDAKTGIEIVSLYGKNRKPQVSDLDGIDIMVFDLQDVGARFYTYISTLHLVMEACAQQNIPVLVLDRPNPNGYYIDGPVREAELKSFIGMHPIPVVYGMSIGELAQMINGEEWLENGVQCDLTVTPCVNYDHNMSYDLPVKPSPNLPNQRSILLYPSLCFFEGTTVSIGRGTSNQFQVIGHPDAKYGSYTFTPRSRPGASAPKHADKRLYGTSLAGLAVQDIMEWKALNLSWLLGYYKEVSSQGQFFLEGNFFDKLAGTYRLRQQLQEGLSEEEIRASWQPGIEKFKERRKQYLLYSDFE